MTWYYYQVIADSVIVTHTHTHTHTRTHAYTHTRSAPYTSGLNLSSINVETDRRGFVPVSDKMEVGAGASISG